MNEEIEKILKDYENSVIDFDEMMTRVVVASNTHLLNSLIAEVEGMKKYHKEFECSGANNGKGCYETFCEDQNCRNAPKEYNQALLDIATSLRKRLDGDTSAIQ